MKKTSRIAPINCEWCNGKIPDSRRGHGSPPKTCSEKCRKERASDREKKRYKKVKDTEHWKDVRAAYLTKLKELRAENPEFEAAFKAYARATQKKWIDKLRESDPEKFYIIKKRARDERAEWRKELVGNPQAFEEHKRKCREWYAALSAEEKERIYFTPRRKREAAKKKSTSKKEQ